MTAGSLTVHIMRPRHCWTILQVSVVAALLLTLNADSEDSSCEVQLKVRRNTVYNASAGEELRINCTVEFCNSSPPAVIWFKNEKTNVPVNVSSSSHIRTEWTQLKDLEGISSLIFKNILRSDSGEYQCRLASGLTVSHVINVSVYDAREPTNVTQRNDVRNNTDSDLQPIEPLWMYVYTAAGIMAFVIIVIIISVASMHGCKGKSKKGTQTDNQYMAIPMAEQPSRPQAAPRGSPSAPPSRRSTRKKTPPPQPNELPLPRDNEHLYGEIKEGRETQRNAAEEEGSSIVYAALNHQLPAGPAARPRRPVEETSEYAAIRIKDH